MNTNKNIVCIIQARMGSSRLPGKVLKEICGQPMLYWVASRANKAESVHQVVIATTKDASDDPIEKWCVENGFDYFRGDAFDVLDRYYQTALAFQAEVIVRLTADCPLMDPYLIDQVVSAFFDKKVHFAANRLPAPFPRTFPIGLDIEVTSMEMLTKAWKEAKLPYEREHVMPFLYSVKNRFKIFILEAENDFGERRWTVDTSEDLKFVRALFEAYDCRVDLSWKKVLRFLDSHSELEAINDSVIHRTFKETDSRADLD